jgi:hypothetical protein
MHAKEARLLGKFAEAAVTALFLTMSGCGGGSTGVSQHTPSPPPSSGHTMQGSWILLFHSDLSDRDTALEANLSQVGNHVFADKTNSLVFQPITHSNSTLLIRLKNFGGKCDSGAVGDVTVDGTVSNPTAAGSLSFTLSETGTLGTMVTTASASSNGLSISDGTYSAPAACGFPEDHGTLTGYQDSIAFSGETYSGTLNGGVGAIVAKVTSTANSFFLSMSGTANGAPFVLAGSTVGFSVDLTGTVGGGNVHWFGLYDPTYNTFDIYDSDSTFLGALNP